MQLFHAWCSSLKHSSSGGLITTACSGAAEATCWAEFVKMSWFHM